MDWWYALPEFVRFLAIGVGLLLAVVALIATPGWVIWGAVVVGCAYIGYRLGGGWAWTAVGVFVGAIGGGLLAERWFGD